MAGYIGQAPANKFLTLDKQTFTTSATDTYSLDKTVSSANEIELFLNNVRQEPIEAYTVSGNTLTLASAITSSDTMYCIYQGKAIGSISPATNSVSNDMLQGNIATSKLADGSAFGDATTVIDTWYINTNLTGGATTLTTNWSQWSGGGYARLSSMTQSSGVFTFPETGIYYIDWQAEYRFSGESRYNEVKIQVTTDNSSYNDRAYGYASISTSGGTGIANGRTSTFIDVTDTALVKVKFGASTENASATLQSSTGNYLQTRAIFMKVANT